MKTRFVLLVSVIFFFLNGSVRAQSVNAFTLVGPIESFKLDPAPADPTAAAARGGMIRVHGVNAVIPSNLIVQMPATYKTPVQIFDEHRDALYNLDPSISGLALDDATKPTAAFEATVIGNIVGGSHIAGLVYITQHGLANGSGFIKSINPTTGLMRIGDSLSVADSPNDALVMLNDSGGVYSPKPDPLVKKAFNIDDRFTVDTGNPTVHSETGYPMCVPGTENALRCPAGNRSLGAGIKRFIMDSQPFITSAGEVIPNCNVVAGGCDPNLEVPFAIGDYVNYAGTLTIHNNGTPSGEIYISAHTMVGWVGIYTQPATRVAPAKPMRAYTSLDVSLIGTMGPPVVNPVDPLGRFIAMEAQDRLKIEGVSTDPSRQIEIYAIDVVPVGAPPGPFVPGTQVLRRISTATPPIAVPLGRYRRIVGNRARVLYSKFFTSNNPANVLKGATRELLVRIDDGTPTSNQDGLPLTQSDITNPLTTTPNGFVAGQYVAPVGEFIFPENTGFGEPFLAANFECLSFLQLGAGPGTARLAPWPGGPAAPTSVTCGPDPK